MSELAFVPVFVGLGPNGQHIWDGEPCQLCDPIPGKSLTGLSLSFTSSRVSAPVNPG